MMLGRFPHLSRIAIKLVEIAGAGCASAVVAFALDNSRHTPPVVPPVQPPAVVRLAPADAQMIETVRSESVALAEHLRSELEARSAKEAPPPPAKSAKPTVTAAPKREQKPVRAQAVDLRPRIPEAKPVQNEAQPVQSTVPYPASAPAATADSSERPTTVTAARDQSPAPAATAPSSWVARLGSASDIPRPPVGISPSVSSSM